MTLTKAETTRIEALEFWQDQNKGHAGKLLDLEASDVYLRGRVRDLESNLRVVAAVLILLLLVAFIVGTAWVTKHV